MYARQSEMGMTVAVTLAMELIEHFHPQFMIMVGIAAGIARSDMAEQIYGDVAVADMIWNYTSGKFVNHERTDIRFGNVGFISRPAVVKTDAELLEYVRKAAASPENQCHIHTGNIPTPFGSKERVYFCDREPDENEKSDLIILKYHTVHFSYIPKEWCEKK